MKQVYVMFFNRSLYNGHPPFPVPDVVERPSVISELVLDFVRERRGFALLSVALEGG